MVLPYIKAGMSPEVLCGSLKDLNTTPLVLQKVYVFKAEFGSFELFRVTKPRFQPLFFDGVK